MNDKQELVPCGLIPYDWLDNYDDFCINKRFCQFDSIEHEIPDGYDDENGPKSKSPPKKPKKHVLCFNAHDGTRIFFAVRT